MADFDLITVEVAYALPHKQKIIALLVEPGTTALEAVKRSKISDHFPELDITSAKLGIFGQSLGTKGLDTADKQVLHAGSIGRWHPTLKKRAANGRKKPMPRAKIKPDPLGCCPSAKNMAPGSTLGKICTTLVCTTFLYCTI
jgi:putative ubiquitin-RnfH superfamily antitoxin RatB of RatAB toxin-antitoxin module